MAILRVADTLRRLKNIGMVSEKLHRNILKSEYCYSGSEEKSVEKLGKISEELIIFEFLGILE